VVAMVGATLIVESALISYVRFWIIMLVEKEMLNVYLLSVLRYMCIWYECLVVYSFVYVTCGDPYNEYCGLLPP
jgi:hypothetical protein